jgi:hypothetical protein
MVTNVTVITNSASTVSIRPSTKSVASLSAIPSSNISLGSLSNVDVANVANGQSLVYNSATGKYVASEVTAVQPTNLVGGSF